jgi:hypothetical protein
LHWNRDSFANDYVSDINKEYQFESMKLGNINTSLNSSFKISLINDDNACIHAWFKRLLLECMMLDWLEPELVFEIFIFECFRFIMNSLKEY